MKRTALYLQSLTPISSHIGKKKRLINPSTLNTWCYPHPLPAGKESLYEMAKGYTPPLIYVTAYSFK